MEQGQAVTPSVGRVVRWRYQSAVQAALVVSTPARDREQHRRERRERLDVSSARQPGTLAPTTSARPG